MGNILVLQFRFWRISPSVVMPCFSSHMSMVFVSLFPLASISYFPLLEHLIKLFSETQEFFISVPLKQIVRYYHGVEGVGSRVSPTSV